MSLFFIFNLYYFFTESPDHIPKLPCTPTALLPSALRMTCRTDDAFWVFFFVLFFSFDLGLTDGKESEHLLCNGEGTFVSLWRCSPRLRGYFSKCLTTKHKPFCQTKGGCVGKRERPRPKLPRRAHFDSCSYLVIIPPLNSRIFGFS